MDIFLMVLIVICYGCSIIDGRWGMGDKGGRFLGMIVICFLFLFLGSNIETVPYAIIQKPIPTEAFLAWAVGSLLGILVACLMKTRKKRKGVLGYKGVQ